MFVFGFFCLLLVLLRFLRLSKKSSLRHNLFVTSQLRRKTPEAFGGGPGSGPVLAPALREQAIGHWASGWSKRLQAGFCRDSTGSMHTILSYYTILCYAILYYTILYYTILYYTILYYTILYYTILYYTILYYTLLYYTIL